MYFDQIAFGNRLQELRKEKHLTQEQAAEQLNISKIHYANLEGGKKGCSIDLLLDLSEMFRVSTDYLLKENPPDRDAELVQIKTTMADLAVMINRL